jgi:hypothetical protein
LGHCYARIPALLLYDSDTEKQRTIRGEDKPAEERHGVNESNPTLHLFREYDRVNLTRCQRPEVPLFIERITDLVIYVRLLFLSRIYATSWPLSSADHKIANSAAGSLRVTPNLFETRSDKRSGRVLIYPVTVSNSISCSKM